MKRGHLHGIATALAALAAAALATACSIGGVREAHRYFVLDPANAAAPPAQVAGVRVAPATTSGFYDTQDIVFSRAPGTRAYYQFSHWTEPPQRTLQRRLAARFAADGAPGALVLHAHLDEIYHDAIDAPGTATIRVSARLVGRGADAGRSVVASRTFERQAPAASYDAAGAVAGFRTALDAIVDDIAGWVATEAQRAKASQPSG